MKKHIPKCLKPIEENEHTETMYVIGNKNKDGKMGMWYGPIPSLEAVLEEIGQDDNSFIIGFMDCLSLPLYRWDDAGGFWFKYGGESKTMNLQGDVKCVEPYDFRIDRSSVLGNPFPMKVYTQEERDRVCELYEEHFCEQISKGNAAFLKELDKIQKAYDKYGMVRLFCWCAPKRCHGETILAWIKS